MDPLDENRQLGKNLGFAVVVKKLNQDEEGASVRGESALLATLVSMDCRWFVEQKVRDGVEDLQEQESKGTKMTSGRGTKVKRAVAMDVALKKVVVVDKERPEGDGVVVVVVAGATL